jgi:hypothetical protein
LLIKKSTFFHRQPRKITVQLKINSFVASIFYIHFFFMKKIQMFVFVFELFLRQVVVRDPPEGGSHFDQLKLSGARTREKLTFHRNHLAANYQI